LSPAEISALAASPPTDCGGNSPPTLTVDEPNGTGDTVTVGQSYNIQYDLADTDDVVTVAFYYDTDNSGLDGTAITGACASHRFQKVNPYRENKGSGAGTSIGLLFHHKMNFASRCRDEHPNP